MWVLHSKTELPENVIPLRSSENFQKKSEENFFLFVFFPPMYSQRLQLANRYKFTLLLLLKISQFLQFSLHAVCFNGSLDLLSPLIMSDVKPNRVKRPKNLLKERCPWGAYRQRCMCVTVTGLWWVMEEEVNTNKCIKLRTSFVLFRHRVSDWELAWMRVNYRPFTLARLHRIIQIQSVFLHKWPPWLSFAVGLHQGQMRARISLKDISLLNKCFLHIMLLWILTEFSVYFWYLYFSFSISILFFFFFCKVICFSV